MTAWVDVVIEKYKKVGVEVVEGFAGPEATGPLPDKCPLCGLPLIEGEMLDSGDSNMLEIIFCPNDDHEAVWFTGNSYRLT